MSNLKYSAITRKSFKVKFTFEAPVEFHLFADLHEELRQKLQKEKIAYSDYDVRDFELYFDIPELKKDPPKEKLFSQGPVHFTDIGTFDNWLGKFKFLVEEFFQSKNIKVTEVYVNGGEYIVDPNAWFSIPEIG